MVNMFLLVPVSFYVCMSVVWTWYWLRSIRERRLRSSFLCPFGFVFSSFFAAMLSVGLLVGSINRHIATSYVILEALSALAVIIGLGGLGMQLLEWAARGIRKVKTEKLTPQSRSWIGRRLWLVTIIIIVYRLYVEIPNRSSDNLVMAMVIIGIVAALLVFDGAGLIAKFKEKPKTEPVIQTDETYDVDGGRYK